jgi:hypothetical protein
MNKPLENANLTQNVGEQMQNKCTATGIGNMYNFNNDK